MITTFRSNRKGWIFGRSIFHAAVQTRGKKKKPKKNASRNSHRTPVAQHEEEERRRRRFFGGHPNSLFPENSFLLGAIWTIGPPLPNRRSLDDSLTRLIMDSLC